MTSTRRFRRFRLLGARLGVGTLLGIFLVPPSAVAPRTEAAISVTDVGANLKLAWTEVQNYLRHLEDIARYIEMVNHQIEQLRRFGDPNYYIGMLGLDKVLAEIHAVQAGIGKTISDVQRIANGVRALQYTGEGLYRDITQLPDRFGDVVNYEVNSFKRFDVSAQLADQYNRDLLEYNRRMDSLGRQYEELLRKLNNAGSQMEADKIRGQMAAVAQQMTVAGHTVQASSDRLNAHVNMVNQMHMRDQEALRQMQMQESRREANALLRQLETKYR